MIIYGLRHGHAEHNIDNLMNGDPYKSFNLTDLGREQAKKAAEELKKIPFDVIITSEFPRTIETAKIIINNHSTYLKNDKRLNDIRTGMEGETSNKYFEELKKIAKAKNIDIINAKINGGESFIDEKERIYSFLDDLKEQNHKIVLIVAHYDTIQIINGYTNNLTNEQMKKNIIENGKIYKFKI